MNSPGHDLFHGWKAPRASSALKGRVLSAAKSEAGSPERRLATDRLWESRAARWAAFAAALFLLIINVGVIDTSSGSARRRDPIPGAVSVQVWAVDPVVADQISGMAVAPRSRAVRRDDVLRLLWSGDEAEGGVSFEGRESA